MPLMAINISNQTIMLHLPNFCYILLHKRHEMNFTDPNQAFPASSCLQLVSDVFIQPVYIQLVQVVVIIGVGVVAGLA